MNILTFHDSLVEKKKEKKKNWKGGSSSSYANNHSACVPSCVLVCVCVCVCVRMREKKSECVSTCVCVCIRVRLRERKCVYPYMRERGWERERGPTNQLGGGQKKFYFDTVKIFFPFSFRFWLLKTSWLGRANIRIDNCGQKLFTVWHVWKDVSQNFRTIKPCMRQGQTYLRCAEVWKDLD